MSEYTLHTRLSDGQITAELRYTVENKTYFIRGFGYPTPSDIQNFHRSVSDAALEAKRDLLNKINKELAVTQSLTSVLTEIRREFSNTTVEE